MLMLLAVALLGFSTSEGAGPYLMWRYFMGAPLSSSPAASGGMIYIGAPDWYIYCVDAGSGRVAWRYMADGEVRERPLVIGNTVIAGCYDGYLYFLDVTSGDLVGRFRADGGITTGVIARGHTLYFGTAGGMLYSLKLEPRPDGKMGARILWKVRARKAISSGPVVAHGMAYFGAKDGSVRGCSTSDGMTVWAIDIGEHIDSPIVLCDSLLSLSSEGTLYGVSASDGGISWKKYLGGRISSLTRSADGKVISGGTNGFVYALDPRSGELLWKRKLGSPISSIPLNLPSGRLLVPVEDGNMVCLRTEDGGELWRFKMPGGSGGDMLWRDGTVYIPSDDGFLYCFSLVVPGGEAAEGRLLWDEWANQYSMGSKVGYIHQWAEEAEGLIRVCEEDVSWEGSFRKALSERLADRNGRLISFRDRRIEGDQVLEFEGRVVGDSIHVVERLAGRTYRKSAPFDSMSVIPELAERILMREGRLSLGETEICTLKVFSYSNLEPCRVTFRTTGIDTVNSVNGRVEALVIEYEYDIDPLRGIRSIEWLDRDGRILKSDTPYLGISYRLVSREEALEWSSPEAESFLFIDTDVGTPADLDELRVIARLKSGDIRRVFKSDRRQKLVVKGENWGEVRIARSRHEGGDATPDASGFGRYVEPNIYVQSDHPEIKELARRIVGGERDPWAASVRILEWVYNNMKPAETHVKFRSAVEILRDMEGTCSEYSVLFIALARAVGIPCRAVIGLAPMGEGRLGLHMWAQVYIGGWIDVDPTWNQRAVDASHIGIAEGSLDPEEMLLLNIPLQIALSNLDTLRVVSYRSKGELCISAVEKLFRQAERLFDPDKSMEILSKISGYPENRRSDDVVLKMGEIYASKKDLRKARKFFEKVVSDYPSSDSAPRALLKLSRMAEEDGDYIRAAGYLQQIAERYPESNIADDALCDLGSIYEKNLKNPGLARRFYSLVLERYPDSGWAIIARDGIERIDKEAESSKGETD